jgi:hypothetical protein
VSAQWGRFNYLSCGKELEMWKSLIAQDGLELFFKSVMGIFWV